VNDARYSDADDSVADPRFTTGTMDGRERTEDEFRSLFARTGFALTRIVPTASPLSVIEAELR